MLTLVIRALTSVCNFNKSSSSVSRLTAPKQLLRVSCPAVTPLEADFSERVNMMSKPHTRPLKTIQWLETRGKSALPARRMVISGRFADVCAEIERLAALESA